MATTSPQAKEERALWGIAVLGGAAAVAAYPLALTFPRGVGLVFAVPLTLAAAGRLRGQRPIEYAALGVLAVLVAGLAFRIGEALLLVMMLGPVATLYLVGSLLLRRDRVAAAVWLTSTSVALIAGFATARVSPDGSAALVVLVVTVGALFTFVRLRRR